MLVDHGHSFDDDAVNRNNLTGIDDDDITPVQPVERHLHLDAVAIKPHEPRLLAEGVQQQLLGIVFGPLDQEAAKAQAPAKDRAGKIDIVPRQPITTIASSTSTPSRRSTNSVSRAFLKVGIEV